MKLGNDYHHFVNFNFRSVMVMTFKLMTLLKVDIVIIIIAKFRKNQITFTYRIFTSKMCAITYGFKCSLDEKEQQQQHTKQARASHSTTRVAR